MWGDAQWRACAPVSAPGAAAPSHANFLLGSIETDFIMARFSDFFPKRRQKSIFLWVTSDFF